MKRVALSMMLLMQSIQAVDTSNVPHLFNVPHLLLHSVATPVLDYAVTYAGQDRSQISWNTSQTFGASATFNKGLDYQWSSASSYGNAVALLLPVVHILASYHLPQAVDSYVLGNNEQRGLLKNIASFLLRHGSVSQTSTNGVQLNCTVASQFPQLLNVVQNFVAEVVVQQLP